MRFWRTTMRELDFIPDQPGRDLMFRGVRPRLAVDGGRGGGGPRTVDLPAEMREDLERRIEQHRARIEADIERAKRGGH